jgi:hypothetical protein
MDGDSRDGLGTFPRANHLPVLKIPLESTTVATTSGANLGETDGPLENRPIRQGEIVELGIGLVGSHPE